MPSACPCVYSLILPAHCTPPVPLLLILLFLLFITQSFFSLPPSKPPLPLPLPPPPQRSSNGKGRDTNTCHINSLRSQLFLSSVHLCNGGGGWWWGGRPLSGTAAFLPACLQTHHIYRRVSQTPRPACTLWHWPRTSASPFPRPPPPHIVTRRGAPSRSRHVIECKTGPSTNSTI